MNLFSFPHTLSQGFGTFRLVPTTKPVDKGRLQALTTGQASQWSPWLHRAAHLSMNPQSSFGGGEHDLQYQKQKHKNSVEHTPAPVNCAATTPCPAPLWPPSQTPCPRLTSQPARSLLSLVSPLSSWYGSRAGPIKLALFLTPGQEFSGSSSLWFSPRVI